MTQMTLKNGLGTGAVRLLAQLKRLATRRSDFLPEEEYNDSYTFINSSNTDEIEILIQ